MKRNNLWIGDYCWLFVLEALRCQRSFYCLPISSVSVINWSLAPRCKWCNVRILHVKRPAWKQTQFVNTACEKTSMETDSMREYCMWKDQHGNRLNAWLLPVKRPAWKQTQHANVPFKTPECEQTQHTNATCLWSICKQAQHTCCMSKNGTGTYSLCRWRLWLSSFDTCQQYTSIIKWSYIS